MMHFSLRVSQKTQTSMKHDISSPPLSPCCNPPLMSCPPLSSSALLSLLIIVPSTVFFAAPLFCPPLLSPSLHTVSACQEVDDQGVRLSWLSHAICGVTRRHAITFSTLLFPPGLSMSQGGLSEKEGLDPEGVAVLR